MSWPYQQLGHVRRPPVLFLHGFMGSGADWLPIAQPLSKKYACILPDLPGHGHHLNFSQPLNFDAVTAELRQLVDLWGGGPVKLVGYSLGGRLALYFATRYPHLVDRLALEGASPGLVDPAARQQRAELDDRRAEQLRAGNLAEFVEQWYQLDLFSTLKNNPRRLAALKERRRQNNAQGLAAAISQLSPGRQPPLWDNLAGLPMPVLLLAGALDAKFSALATQMAAQIPQATVELVPQAGHNVHFEQPEQFTRRLAAFLA